MKIKSTTSKRKKKGIIASTVVLVVLLASGGFFLWHRTNTPASSSANNGQQRPVNSVDYSPAKPSDNVGNSSKDDTAKNEPSQPATTPKTLTVTITNTSEDNAMVYLRAITDGATTGQCTATFTLGSNKIVKTAPLTAQANYGICQGFNVAKDEFSVGGTWKVVLSIAAASLTGTKEGSVQVTK